MELVATVLERVGTSLEGVGTRLERAGTRLGQSHKELNVNAHKEMKMHLLSSWTWFRYVPYDAFVFP